ncbi:MAG: histone H1 [Flavobacterium sp.]|nr:histone H1 [Flavobacterium sp.]
MENLKKLAELNDTAQTEGAKFAAGNKAAGTRLRKALQEIKNLAHEMRKEVSDVKNQ